MSDVLIAEGNLWSLAGLGGYENKLAEGDTGRLDVSLRGMLASPVVDGLKASIKASGVSLTNLWQDSSAVLHIQCVKKIGFLAIVAVAIAAAIVIIALVVSWKLFKMSPAAVVASIGIWLALIVGAVAVVAFAWRKT